MDLVGMKEHDEQHAQTERTPRRLVEQVGQLSIDLGQRRTDMRRLHPMVQGKVDAADVDPLFVAANDAAGQARVRPDALQVSTDEQWNGLGNDLDEAPRTADERAGGLVPAEDAS